MIRFVSSIRTGLYLKKNSVLKELWLAHNDLTFDDAYNIGIVLKSNFHLQFLDLSNNNIQVCQELSNAPPTLVSENRFVSSFQ